MLPEWTADFLAALEACPNVAAATRAAGITKQRAYQLRKESADFAARWDDALDTAVDDLVGDAWARARASDTLTIFLLKSHRPAVYRDKVELTGKGGAPIPVQLYIPDNGRDATAADDPPQ